MKRKLFFVFVLFLVIVVVIGGSFVHDVFLISPKSDAKPVEVVVTEGDSVNAIDVHLEKAGLVSHPLFFKWFVEFTHTQTKLQAGTFFLTPGTSIASLVLLLSNVQNAEVQVTIPEGFTNDQIKAKLVEAFSKFDTIEWDKQASSLEGSLFPDTYRFAKNASVKEIVEKMRSTLDRRLVENNIDFLNCDMYQPSMGSVSPTRCDLHGTLVLASLIEKEVQTPEDMRHVAGIFLNRLAIGMPLQTDTSSYTYKNKGLPPSPINNPGMNAILAVLHPAQTKDLYFITLPNHTTVYAQTFAEHIKNQQTYLK
ncbi:MAG: endolytic transglycosylase MltG [Candidatus Uhrbacteria bacterium]|nr:endolytic transglycosylase MltG [Candidatus Uhrbacteria bacterium]